MIISMLLRRMLLINNIGEIMYKLISIVLTLSLAMGLACSVFAENILEEIQSRGEIRMAESLYSSRACLSRAGKGTTRETHWQST